METLQESFWRVELKGYVLQSGLLARSNSCRAACFPSLVDSEEPGRVDQVVYEPLHNLWRDTNSVVIFAHRYIEADICL